MRAYIISKSDIDRLLAAIDRDPDYGRDGGSSCALSEKERTIYRDAHKFFNYQVRMWLDSIARDQ